MATWREPVQVGRGDVNPNGIPVVNPHEREMPPEMERALENGLCITCGELSRGGTRCERCECNLEEDRLNRELGR